MLARGKERGDEGALKSPILAGARQSKEPEGHGETFGTAFSAVAHPRASISHFFEVAEERTVVMGVANKGFGSNYISTTKYTPLTFLPQNLFEQFLRIANFYFLIMAILNSIPQISPYDPWTSIFPLVFVLAVTAVKEAYEDYQRAKQDKKSNSTPVKVVRRQEGGSVGWVEGRWQDVCVGEVILLKDGDQVPCDMLLVSTSEEEGTCYIESANLDGETNLKLYQAPPSLVAAFTNTPFAVSGHVQCEVPNNRIYKFVGSVEVNGDTHPLDYRTLLLRGHTLRNTEWVTGVAVYTGNETKLMKNSTRSSLKQSRLEGKANRNIMMMLTVQFVLSLTGCVMFYVVMKRARYWYLDLDAADSLAELTVFDFFTWLILLGTLIPISLYVSIELVKVLQAIFVAWDLNMYSPEYKVNAQARTSNLNEELGQVQYIFSDKTGTLTRNQMNFMKCSIGTHTYGRLPDEGAEGSPSEVGSEAKETDSVFFDPNLDHDLKIPEPHGEALREFLTLCALCHTVVRSKEGGSSSYQGASPDEIALVKFAASKGFRFIDRDPRSVAIEVPMANGQGSQTLRYDVLNILEFDSTRKRMSVIVKTPDGRIELLCKGADTVILERLAPGDQLREAVEKHLAQFAREGLRTLCLARTELDAGEYGQWNELYKAATVALQDRDEKVAGVAELIEKELTLVGASAIEDRLQHGVPSTISTLLKANIRIWMLTGDKEETAIQIAHSCRLLESDELVSLTAGATPSQSDVERVLRSVVEGGGGGNCPTRQIIIDGRTLEICLSDFPSLMLGIAPLARAVIVCRATPLQKAQIVTLVKEGMGKITLAIGDGANDVPMIMAAHIGVGIQGEEGCQAVLASDYSIGQFRFLLWLLLVQGRWFYQRIATLFLYSFYKNYALTMCHVWLGLWSGFSAQTFFNDLVISMFNTAYASVPILIVGVFDRDLQPSTILQHPEVYVDGQLNKQFKLRRFWGWIILGVFQSLFIFFVPVHAFGDMDGSGRQYGFWFVSFVSTSCCVIITNLKIFIEARLFNWLHFAAIAFGILSFFLSALVYEVYLGWNYPNDPNIGVVPTAMADARYWLVVLFVVVTALAPDFLVRAASDLHFPSRVTLLREQEVFGASRTPNKPLGL